MIDWLLIIICAINNIRLLFARRILDWLVIDDNNKMKIMLMMLLIAFADVIQIPEFFLSWHSLMSWIQPPVSSSWRRRRRRRMDHYSEPSQRVELFREVTFEPGSNWTAPSTKRKREMIEIWILLEGGRESVRRGR